MSPLRPSQRAYAALRKPIQVLVAILGWVGFVWLWVLVDVRPWESEGLVWLIAGSFIVFPLVTGAWVIHNRSIFERKGERRAVAVAETTYTHDWHGRSVTADWPSLKRSRLVHVSVDGARKIYRRAPNAQDAASPPLQHRHDTPSSALHSLNA